MDWRVFEQEENLAGGHYLSFFGGQNDGAGFDSIRFDVAAEVALNTGDVGIGAALMLLVHAPK